MGLLCVQVLPGVATNKCPLTSPSAAALKFLLILQLCLTVTAYETCALDQTCGQFWPAVSQEGLLTQQMGALVVLSFMDVSEVMSASGSGSLMRPQLPCANPAL